MFDWSGIYFRDIVKTPPHLVTLGYTAFMAMMATGRFVGDRLVTKFGVKRVLQLSGCLIVTGLLTAILIPNLYMTTAGFLLIVWLIKSLGIVPNIDVLIFDYNEDVNMGGNLDRESRYRRVTGPLSPRGALFLRTPTAE